MRTTQRGFSLIEIMVVIVILGILASLIIPKIMGRPDEARQVKAKQDILSLENALELYKLDNGFYPSTEQGLEALAKQPTQPPIPTNWQPLLRTLPTDPWGNTYKYSNPGEHGEIDVYSLGPNSNTTHNNTTQLIIGNWNVK